MSLGKALKQDCVIPGIPVMTVFATGHTDRPTQIMRTSFQGSVIVKGIMCLSKSCLPHLFPVFTSLSSSCLVEGMMK